MPVTTPGLIVSSSRVNNASDVGVSLPDLERPLICQIHVSAMTRFAGVNDPNTPIIVANTDSGLKTSRFQDIYYNRIWIIPRIRNFGVTAVARSTKVEVWNSFFEDRNFGSITEIGDVDNLVSITGLDSGTYPSLKSRVYRVDVDDLVTVPSVDVTYDWNFTGSGDTGQVFRVLAQLLTFEPLVIVPSTQTIPEGGTVDYDATGGSGAFMTVDWSVTGDSTIDVNGTVTAGTAGVYTVTAHDTFADYYDTAELIVTSPVFITPDTAVIELGDTFDFNATGGSSTDYEWSITGGNTIDDGVVTAGEEGIWVVTVYEPFSGFSDTALIAISIDCADGSGITIVRGQEFPLGLQ